VSGSTLPLLRFQGLAEVPGVRHGISTRAGGVSAGRFASLNTSYSVGDVEAHVDENLARVAGALAASFDQLAWPHQVHGDRAVVVDRHTPNRERCDILLTESRERVLLLRFADCVPVLLADRARPAVAAVHAGWRGSAARAARAAVRAMAAAFGSRPADLVAGIGPSIGRCCYEVGPEVAQRFGDRPGCVVEGVDGVRLDLWEANRRDLVEAGLAGDRIEVAGVCTRCQADRFFSHRANGGRPAGRFAAVIGLI
jgi:polyphenol oxidase